jgi:hypothetical protein
MRRKGEDTFAMKRRRMPYVAKIKREDPFRSTRDRRHGPPHCCRRRAFLDRRLAREETGFLLFYFETWARPPAMQHWIDRSGIAGRPMPARFDGPQIRVGDN